ncbi:GNAT family N-acetyltransferase [Maribacter hydrothermalis]|uniref:Acetyltransferase n=1 Tax=Maribacter hydrothermalis TaxID=1836467 RepID=A0A1B7Z7U5_9FLAO|nr:GNAT family N-acetyltransferase [Maribacter hydrothermalis]APQ15823.1 GNAT family N-acetyltransferase [Maribacter hydrothermalis]OBR38798.1 acetyltransferase [Maribacter hydrothermalis]
MVTLKGNHIYLRALEQNDLDFLFELENDTDVWELSGTITPYSKNVLQLYLDNAHRDLFDVKQLRLVICDLNEKAVGLIDVFDFEPNHKRAGIGIIILDKEQRNKGFGGEAVSILCNYLFNILGLRQIYANILEENVASLHLFKKLGFVEIGIKKDWIRDKNTFKNEILLQKINR